jgi:phosphotransferase system HPr-like phosphotransfer protein
MDGEKAGLQTCDMTFLEKADFFSYDYLKCCIYLIHCESPVNAFTKSFFAKLITLSHLLEDFLDFHGAKNNSKWYFYRELAAAVRHISLAGYAQRHICSRLIFYDIDGKDEFAVQGEIALDFMRSSLIKLAPVILEEAKRLKISIPEKGYSAEHFPRVTSSEMLDYDFEDEEKADYRKHIVWVANEFVTIAKDFESNEFFNDFDEREFKDMVPEKVNEVGIRRFEMLVHNLQSSFDTYIIHGGYLYGNRILKRFRSYFSVIYHLLQIIGRLLHFYERHLIKIGYKHIYNKAWQRLVKLVDPDILLNCTIRYGLHYVDYFFASGKEVAQEILSKNIERSSIRVPIPQDLGFHCRPSLMVAKIVQNYGGQVEMVVGKDRFDASSVLDMQWAGGKIQKENIHQVVFEGDVRALKDIETLASVNYGEDRMGKGIPLPKSLQYLK